MFFFVHTMVLVIIKIKINVNRSYIPNALCKLYILLFDYELEAQTEYFIASSV